MAKAKRKPGASMKVRVSTGIVETTKKREKQLSTVNTTVQCSHAFFHALFAFGILLPKLFRPTVRKNCSTDQKKLLKFEAEAQEFAKKNIDH